MKKKIELKSIDEIMKEDSKDLICLTLTRNLKNENGLPHPIWDWLKNQYEIINKSPVSAEHRTYISVLNSILNQERIFFALTRTKLLSLVKGDLNFKKRGIGFDKKSYSFILHKLQKEGIVQKYLDPDSKNNATGYEVINPIFLEFLDRKINRELQKQQVVDFVNRNQKQTESQTALRTKYNSIKVYKNNTEYSQDINTHDKTETVAGVSPSTSLTVNPEHQDLLTAAKLVNPVSEYHKTWLADKDEKLAKYGSFTEKQLTVLKQIVITKSPKKQLVVGCIKAIVENNTNPEIIANEIMKYDYQSDDNYQKLCCSIATYTNNNKILGMAIFERLEIEPLQSYIESYEREVKSKRWNEEKSKVDLNTVKTEIVNILKRFKLSTVQKTAVILNINNIWFMSSDDFQKFYGTSGSNLKEINTIRDEWLKVHKAKYASITEQDMPLKQSKIA